MALVPEDGQEMKHRAAMFLVAEGWNVLEYNCSQIVAETIGSTCYQAFSQRQEVDVAQTLVDGIQQANRNVYQIDQLLFEQDPDLRADLNYSSAPLATCAAVVVSQHTASLAHVGWSRAYLLRHGQVKARTEDHTLMASLVRAGMITAQEAKNHPQRNQIYRVLGYSSEVDVDITVELVQDGDILVLCTHRLAEYMQEEELSRMIIPGRLQQSAQNLIQEARKCIVAGKDGDNYSAFCNLTLMAVSISLPQDED